MHVASNAVKLWPIRREAVDQFIMYLIDQPFSIWTSRLYKCLDILGGRWYTRNNVVLAFRLSILYCTMFNDVIKRRYIHTYNDKYKYEFTLPCVSLLTNKSCHRRCVLIYFTGPVCLAFVNLYPGSQSIGATPMPLLTNMNNCEVGCRADPTCLSYQINTNPGQVYCWYQTNQGQLDPNQMANQPNVVEYIKTNNCACKYPCQC